jgi:cell division protein DivIC
VVGKNNFINKLRQNPWFKLATNIYAAIGLFFVIWMIFLDTNSLLIYLNLERKLNDLERQKATLEQDIVRDMQTLQQLNDSVQLERYARERYLMKRKNEDIYLIEYADSIN